MSVHWHDDWVDFCPCDEPKDPPCGLKRDPLAYSDPQGNRSVEDYEIILGNTFAMSFDPRPGYCSHEEHYPQ